MNHSIRSIKTALSITAASILLTACIPLPFASGASKEPEAIYIEPNQPAVYGVPSWAVLTPGKVTCSGGKFYTIIRAEAGNFIVMNWQGKQYTLNHVPTTTGTYRYEDYTSGLVIVQIPAKALLLNSKIGQRLADECKK